MKYYILQLPRTQQNKSNNQKIMTDQIQPRYPGVQIFDTPSIQRSRKELKVVTEIGDENINSQLTSYNKPHEAVGDLQRVDSTKLTITVQKTERTISQMQAYDNTQSPMVSRTLRQSPSNQNPETYNSQSNIDMTAKAKRDPENDIFSNEVQSPQLNLNMPQMMEINIRRINQQGNDTTIKPSFAINNGSVNIQIDSKNQFGFENLRNSQGEISFQEQTTDEQANPKRSKKRNKNGKFNNTFHASKFSVGVVEGSQLIPQHQQMQKEKYAVKKLSVRVKNTHENNYSPEQPKPYQNFSKKVTTHTANRRTSRMSDNQNHSSQYNQDIDDCDEYANLKQSFNVTQLSKDMNKTLYMPRGSAHNTYNEVQPKIILQGVEAGKESSGEARSTTTHKAQSNEVSILNQSQPKMTLLTVTEGQEQQETKQTSVFSNRRTSQNEQATTPISNSQLLPREAAYSPSDHGGYSEHIHRSTYSNQHTVVSPPLGPLLPHGPIQQLYQFVDSSNLVPMNNNHVPDGIQEGGQQSGEVTFSLDNQNQRYDHTMDPNFEMQNEFMQHLFQQNIITSGGNLSQDPQKAQYIQQLHQLAQMTGFAPQPNLPGNLNLPLGPQFSTRQNHPFARSARPPPMHKKDALNGGVWPQAIHKVANISQSNKVHQLLVAQKKKQEKAEIEKVAHTTRSQKPPNSDILSHSMCRFTQSILNSQVKMNVDPTRWMPTGSLVIDNKIAPPNFKVTPNVLKMPVGTQKVTDQRRSVSPKNKNAYIKIENINSGQVNIPSRLNDQSPDFLQEASVHSNKTNFNIMSSRRLQTLKHEAKLTDKFQNGALVAQKAVINQINIKQAIAQMQFQQMKQFENNGIKSSMPNSSQVQNPDNIDISDHRLPVDSIQKQGNLSSDKTRISPNMVDIGMAKNPHLNSRFRGNTSVISSIQNAPERDSKMIETMLTDFKKNSNSKANLIANHIDSTNSIQQTTNSGQQGKTLHQESQTFATILLNKQTEAQKTNSESNLKTGSNHFRSRYDNEDMTFQAIVNTDMSQTNIGFGINVKMEEDKVIKEAAQEQEVTVATPVNPQQYAPIKIPKLNDTFTQGVSNGFKETFGISNPIKEEDFAKSMYSQMKSTGLSKRGGQREGMQLVPTIFPIIGQKGQVVNDKNQTFSKKKISVSAKPTPDATKDYHSEIEEKNKIIHVIPQTNNSNDYNSNDAQTLREASTSMMNHLQNENSMQNIQTTFLYKKDYSSRNKIFTPRSNLGKNSPHGTHSRKNEDNFNYSQHRSQTRKVDNDDLGGIIDHKEGLKDEKEKKNFQRAASKTRNELIKKINTESKTIIPKSKAQQQSPVRISDNKYSVERQKEREKNNLSNQQVFNLNANERIITDKNEEQQLAIVNFERDMADVTESHFGARSITIHTRQTTRGGEQQTYEEVPQIRPALSCNPGLPSAFQNKKYHYSLEGRGQQIYTQRNYPPTIKAQTMKGKKKFMPPNSNIKPIKYRVLNIKDQKEQQDKKEQTKRQSIVDQFTQVMNQTQRLKTKQGFWTGFTNHDAEIAKKVHSSIDSNDQADNTMENWEEYENSDRPLDQTIGNFGQHFQYDSDGERQYFVNPNSRDRNGFAHQNNSFSIPGSKMPNFTQKTFGLKNNSFLNQRTAQEMDLGFQKFGAKKNTTQIYSNTVYMKPERSTFPTLSDKLSAIRDKKNQNSDDYSSFLTRNQQHNQNIIRQRVPKPQNLKQYMMHNTISPPTHYKRKQPQLAPIDVLANTPYGMSGGAIEESYSPLFSPGIGGLNNTFADVVNKQLYQPNKTGRLPFDQQANTTFTASNL